MLRDQWSRRILINHSRSSASYLMQHDQSHIWSSQTLRHTGGWRLLYFLHPHSPRLPSSYFSRLPRTLYFTNCAGWRRSAPPSSSLSVVFALAQCPPARRPLLHTFLFPPLLSSPSSPSSIFPLSHFAVGFPFSLPPWAVLLGARFPCPPPPLRPRPASDRLALTRRLRFTCLPLPRTSVCDWRCLRIRQPSLGCPCDSVTKHHNLLRCYK